MSPRRGDRRGKAVEQFEKGEHELGLAAGQRLGQNVADRPVVAVPVQPFTGERGAGAVAQQPFEAGTIRRFEAHAGVQ